MSTIEPSLAGPKRPQDRVLLSEVDDQFNDELERTYKKHNDPRVAGRGRGLRLRQRRRGDRRDHQLHQHVQPVGAGRRRPRRPQGPREGPDEQAVGQDQPRAGQPGGHRLSQRERPQRGPRRARLRPRRLRLHDLHRQFGPARRSRSARRSTTRTWSPSACFPATAISKAGCRPTAAPITSPRRRWWSLMRSRAPSAPTWSTSRSAPAATASRSSSRTSGRRTRKSAR